MMKLGSFFKNKFSKTADRGINRQSKTLEDLLNKFDESNLHQIGQFRDHFLKNNEKFFRLMANAKTSEHKQVQNIFQQLKSDLLSTTATTAGHSHPSHSHPSHSQCVSMTHKELLEAYQTEFNHTLKAFHNNPTQAGSRKAIMAQFAVLSQLKKEGIKIHRTNFSHISSPSHGKNGTNPPPPAFVFWEENGGLDPATLKHILNKLSQNIKAIGNSTSGSKKITISNELEKIERAIDVLSGILANRANDINKYIEVAGLVTKKIDQRVVNECNEQTQRRAIIEAVANVYDNRIVPADVEQEKFTALILNNNELYESLLKGNQSLLENAMSKAVTSQIGQPSPIHLDQLKSTSTALGRLARILPPSRTGAVIKLLSFQVDHAVKKGELAAKYDDIDDEDKPTRMYGKVDEKTGHSIAAYAKIGFEEGGWSATAKPALTIGSQTVTDDELRPRREHYKEGSITGEAGFKLNNLVTTSVMLKARAEKTNAEEFINNKAYFKVEAAKSLHVDETRYRADLSGQLLCEQLCGELNIDIDQSCSPPRTPVVKDTKLIGRFTTEGQVELTAKVNVPLPTAGFNRFELNGCARLLGLRQGVTTRKLAFTPIADVIVNGDKSDNHIDGGAFNARMRQVKALSTPYTGFIKNNLLGGAQNLDMATNQQLIQALNNLSVFAANYESAVLKRDLCKLATKSTHLNPLFDKSYKTAAIKDKHRLENEVRGGKVNHKLGKSVNWGRDQTAIGLVRVHAAIGLQLRERGLLGQKSPPDSDLRRQIQQLYQHVSRQLLPPPYAHNHDRFRAGVYAPTAEDSASKTYGGRVNIGLTASATDAGTSATKALEIEVRKTERATPNRLLRGSEITTSFTLKTGLDVDVLLQNPYFNKKMADILQDGDAPNVVKQALSDTSINGVLNCDCSVVITARKPEMFKKASARPQTEENRDSFNTANPAKHSINNIALQLRSNAITTVETPDLTGKTLPVSVKAGADITGERTNVLFEYLNPATCNGMFIFKTREQYINKDIARAEKRVRVEEGYYREAIKNVGTPNSSAPIHRELAFYLEEYIETESRISKERKQKALEFKQDFYSACRKYAEQQRPEDFHNAMAKFDELFNIQVHAWDRQHKSIHRELVVGDSISKSGRKVSIDEKKNRGESPEQIIRNLTEAGHPPTKVPDTQFRSILVDRPQWQPAQLANHAIKSALTNEANITDLVKVYDQTSKKALYQGLGNNRSQLAKSFAKFFDVTDHHSPKNLAQRAEDSLLMVTGGLLGYPHEIANGVSTPPTKAEKQQLSALIRLLDDKLMVEPPTKLTKHKKPTADDNSVNVKTLKDVAHELFTVIDGDILHGKKERQMAKIEFISLLKTQSTTTGTDKAREAFKQLARKLYPDDQSTQRQVVANLSKLIKLKEKQRTASLNEGEHRDMPQVINYLQFVIQAGKTQAETTRESIMAPFEQYRTTPSAENEIAAQTAFIALMQRLQNLDQVFDKPRTTLRDLLNEKTVGTSIKVNSSAVGSPHEGGP